MAEVTIVYWRDIPAQVIVGKGRRGVQGAAVRTLRTGHRPLCHEDRRQDADAYLAEWRKAAVAEVEGEPDAIAAAEAARLEAEFDTARLKALIDADGWAKA